MKLTEPYKYHPNAYIWRTRIYGLHGERLRIVNDVIGLHGLNW